MRVEIRRAGPEDACPIACVHAVSWRVSYADILPERYLRSLAERPLTSRWRHRLKEAAREGDDVWVISVNGAVVGFSQAGAARGRHTDGFGEVTMLYLHPRATGHGLGGHLFRRTVDALSDRGFRWLEVWVLADNRPARQFYARMGLRPDGGTRWDHFGETPVRVVRYACALDPVVDFAALKRRHEPS